LVFRILESISPLLESLVRIECSCGFPAGFECFAEHLVGSLVVATERKDQGLRHLSSDLWIGLLLDLREDNEVLDWVCVALGDDRISEHGYAAADWDRLTITRVSISAKYRVTLLASTANISYSYLTTVPHSPVA